MERCGFCGHVATMIWVHGHYQCSHCRQITVPCCNGETAGCVVPQPEQRIEQERRRAASRYPWTG
jgi:hypothetical protein